MLNGHSTPAGESGSCAVSPAFRRLRSNAFEISFDDQLRRHDRTQPNQ